MHTDEGFQRVCFADRCQQGRKACPCPEQCDAPITTPQGCAALAAIALAVVAVAVAALLAAYLK